MSAEVKNEYGMIRISNAVIAKLAGFAATQCYGVVGMAVRSSKDGIARLLKKESMDRGIKVKVTENVVDVALFVIMEYIAVKFFVVLICALIWMLCPEWMRIVDRNRTF